MDVPDHTGGIFQLMENYGLVIGDVIHFRRIHFREDFPGPIYNPIVQSANGYTASCLERSDLNFYNMVGLFPVCFYSRIPTNMWIDMETIVVVSLVPYGNLL